MRSRVGDEEGDDVALMERVLRMGEKRILRSLESITRQVNAIEDEFVSLSDKELRALTPQYKERVAQGESLDEVMVEAFATVREAAKRTLGQRHFDVQITGGAALHMGNIAEMKTGEGKTLVATLPAYLNALSGRGVHIVTVNDYLAERDSEWMGRIHRFLGLTVGSILASMSATERRAAYAADITYGTNNEFGFDYLRDNMAWSKDEMVQRGHAFAIVDEVDSILIDEARTPLIISGPSDDAPQWYTEFARLVLVMKRGDDYEVDEKKKTVAVGEPAIDKVEDQLGIDNLYDTVNSPLVSFLNNAVRAKELYKRDRDYVVIKGEILIVDEHTGRILSGRRYSEGLHQALEAKENVEIMAENQTLATITLQNYFRLYDKLSGMTGTAMTEASEFSKIYNLGVVAVPTNQPMIRDDMADLVYRTEEAKFEAVVDDIAARNAEGQPVLVGTVSVEKSEYLADLLRKRGVPHEVLNAKQHEREATIVAQAGRKGAVTVATNMAGRGTDIMLGGNSEFLAATALSQGGLNAVESPDEYEKAWPEALAEAQGAVAAEHDEVTAAGGLFVLGTERHESRRIDNQLRGRSGRQGDPGGSRFYLSLQDDLMRLFKADIVDSFLRRFNVPDDVPIEAGMVTKAIASAQTQREAQNFEIRKDVLKYDDVLNRQRMVIYDERRRVLEGEDISAEILAFAEDTIRGYVRVATGDGYAEDWDLDQLWTALRQLYPVGVSVDDVIEDSGGDVAGLSVEYLIETLLDDIREAYSKREDSLGEEAMREFERRVVLSVLDRKWREHLHEMDHLRHGVGLRAMAQRDPLVEYQREGYDLFMGMMESIKEESVGYLFNAEVQVEGADDDQDVGPAELVDEESVTAETLSAAIAAQAAAGAVAAASGPHVRARGLGPSRPKHMEYLAPSEDGPGVSVRSSDEFDDEPEQELPSGATRAQRRRAQRSRRKRGRG
ncbi:MAG: preprotein translocase subunit SecA [Candidatus Nanopelagicales bacterium]|nr:preprotein translocase subunit SecA [Candidatus Nanopelagicales bacterium]MDZ4249947.1 preprotein translocase subunit SecA [Candidatus Nanopelagicales bacterium]